MVVNDCRSLTFFNFEVIKLAELVSDDVELISCWQSKKAAEPHQACSFASSLALSSGFHSNSSLWYALIILSTESTMLSFFSDSIVNCHQPHDKMLRAIVWML